MSGAYAKEFEKWLEGNRIENPNNAESDDPDMIHGSDSDDEVDNLSGHGSLSSLENQRIGVETAPMLTDDEDSNDEYDDEIQKEKNRHYEEPPILEPVPSMPNQKQSLKSSGLDEAPFSHVKHSQKGIDRKKSKSNVCSEQKGITWQGRHNCEQGKEESFYSDGTNTSDEYSKHSGNIFDKLNSISEQSDDVPPPLIPSPGADAPSPNGNDNECSSANLPNNSPDFCAMEADSTSEMLKSNLEDHCFGKKEKNIMVNSQGDVSIECDSTCMLGVSPNVLSPNADIMEDSGNQSDSQACSRGPTNGISEELFPLSGLNESPCTHSSVTEAKGEEKTNKSGSWNQDCPTLEVAVTLEEKKENESHQDIPTEEPPVLSVIMPESYHSLRRKRHTIDTVENISSSAKRKHTISSSPIRSERQVETDSLEPPNLARQPETENVICPQDRSNKHRKLSTRKHAACSKKSHRSKNEHRNRSYSLVDMNKFVKRTSQLSHLQSRMHKLISLLFPQIKPDMETMSPESIHFENVLVDLASPMQEPVDGAIDKSVMSCVQTSKKKNVDRSSENFSQCALNSSPGGEFGVDHSLQLCNSSFAASLHHTETNLISSGHSTGSYLTSGLHETGSSEDLSSSESMIPKLSQLTLTSEKEKIIQRQPSVVIKANACEALKSFSGLACNVLQLLLPDLSINLFDALGDSYHDLLNLIDSVILLNSG